MDATYLTRTLSIILLLIHSLILFGLFLSWDIISETYRWIQSAEAHVIAEQLGRKGYHRNKD
jgi:hypothetical protein